MLQKRDEYLPKRRKGRSKIQKEQDEEEEKDYAAWAVRMSYWEDENPYCVEVYSHNRLIRYIVRSPFPQRYPHFDLLMNDLLQDWRKRQTQLACKRIKEELMMNRWHPDRVEKLLELGMLDDLD